MRLGYKYFATEELIQDVVETLHSVIQTCRDSFKSSLNDENFKNDCNEIMMKNFDESLQGLLEAHDKNTGVFRSSYKRKQYFKTNSKFVQPVTIPLLDKEKKESGHILMFQF